MQELYHSIEMSLETVFDPDFPIVDIYTLGLIYSIDINEKEKKIKIVMTFTTPVCPMADYIMKSVRNAASIPAPDYDIEVVTTFDPMRSPKMIKDEDLQRMFE